MFAHTIGMVKGDNWPSLLEEDRRLRDELPKFCGRLKWKCCSDGARARGLRRFADRFLNWYECEGYRLIGFYTLIVDQASSQWEAWHYPTRFHVYNHATRRALQGALAYLKPHVPMGDIRIKMVSDWRLRAVADNFAEYLPRIAGNLLPLRHVEFVAPVRFIGRKSDFSDPLVRAEGRVLEYVDFMVGLIRGCYRPEVSEGHFKYECIERVSRILECLRPFEPRDWAHLKRSFEATMFPDHEARCTRWFPLPGIADSA